MKELLKEVKTYYLEEMSKGNWMQALQLYMQLPEKFQDRGLIRSWHNKRRTHKLIDAHFSVWPSIINRLEYALTGELPQTSIEARGRKKSIDPPGHTTTPDHLDYLVHQVGQTIYAKTEARSAKEQNKQFDEDLEARKARLSNQLNQVPDGKEHDQQRKELATEIMSIEQALRGKEREATMTDDQKGLQKELKKLESKRRNAASTRKKWEIKQTEEVDASEARKEEIAKKIAHYAATHAKFDSDVDEMRARIEATA